MENIKSTKCQKFKKYSELSEKEKSLIKGAVKAHALGIIHPSSRLDCFMEYSRGESIILDWNNLDTQILQSESNRAVVHYHFWNVPIKTNFKPINSWLNHKIEKNVLVFSGVPSKDNVGKYIIRIYDSNEFIVREFGVEVVDPNATTEVSGRRNSFGNFVSKLSSSFSHLSPILGQSYKLLNFDKKKDLDDIIEKANKAKTVGKFITDNLGIKFQTTKNEKSKSMTTPKAKENDIEEVKKEDDKKRDQKTEKPQNKEEFAIEMQKI